MKSLFLRTMAVGRAVVRSVAGMGARFFFFAAGLVAVWIGGSRLHDAAGWLLVGLLIVWDAARVEAVPPAGRNR